MDRFHRVRIVQADSVALLSPHCGDVAHKRRIQNWWVVLAAMLFGGSAGTALAQGTGGSRAPSPGRRGRYRRGRRHFHRADAGYRNGRQSGHWHHADPRYQNRHPVQHYADAWASKEQTRDRRQPPKVREGGLWFYCSDHLPVGVPPDRGARLFRRQDVVPQLPALPSRIELIRRMHLPPLPLHHRCIDRRDGLWHDPVRRDPLPRVSTQSHPVYKVYNFFTH